MANRPGKVHLTIGMTGYWFLSKVKGNNVPRLAVVTGRGGSDGTVHLTVYGHPLLDVKEGGARVFIRSNVPVMAKHPENWKTQEFFVLHAGCVGVAPRWCDLHAASIDIPEDVGSKEESEPASEALGDTLPGEGLEDPVQDEDPPPPPAEDEEDEETQAAAVADVQRRFDGLFRHPAMRELELLQDKHRYKCGPEEKNGRLKYVWTNKPGIKIASVEWVDGQGFRLMAASERQLVKVIDEVQSVPKVREMVTKLHRILDAAAKAKTKKEASTQRQAAL